MRLEIVRRIRDRRSLPRSFDKLPSAPHCRNTLFLYEALCSPFHP
jgi:hypothetical protein